MGFACAKCERQVIEPEQRLGTNDAPRSHVVWRPRRDRGFDQADDPRWECRCGRSGDAPRPFESEGAGAHPHRRVGGLPRWRSVGDRGDRPPGVHRKACCWTHPWRADARGDSHGRRGGETTRPLTIESAQAHPQRGIAGLPVGDRGDRPPGVHREASRLNADRHGQHCRGVEAARRFQATDLAPHQRRAAEGFPHRAALGDCADRPPTLH